MKHHRENVVNCPPISSIGELQSLIELFRQGRIRQIDFHRRIANSEPFTWVDLGAMPK